MKKIININFQGRVIPIEESAYETLKVYVESLRRYFQYEDGRDEIINDIESRIAELFSERLKRGSACITDDDVNAVIASIGRPEDFEQQDSDSASSSSNTGKTGNGSASANTATGQQQYNYGANYATGNSRLYRNADDKIIAGVCSGLANSLRIDPAIMRILFVVFFGVTFWIYIILWIVVPVQSIKTNITKRLYRDPEHRIIGGVCGGLASYFNTEIWIPRLIFGLPLLLSVANGAFRGFWFNFHYFPGFLTGSMVTTLTLVYIVLWIVLPEATTTSEKLEMRGEKIDLNTIRTTVKEDLQGVKERAEKFGAEVKDAAQNFGSRAASLGQQAGQRAQSMGAEAIPAARRGGSGLGNAIGIMFKIFFLFIAGCIMLSLLGALVGIFVSALTVMPFVKGYLLDSTGQDLLAWTTLVLFVGIPILAIVVWLVRRIAGVKTRNHYIGYAFGALWIVGLFCFIALGISIKRNFDYKARIPQDYSISQPLTGKLTVRVANATTRYYGAWWGGNWPGPFNFTDDSLVVKNVRVKIEKSKDSIYHVFATKYSNGSTSAQAEEFARTLGFQVNQQDSTLFLDNGFSLPGGQKFRNQQVLVTVQVPIGKRILVDRSVSRRYHWFMIDRGGIHGGEWGENWDDDNESYYYSDNIEYTMTAGGLERTDGKDKKRTSRRNRNDNFNDDQNDSKSNDNIQNNKGNSYRYKELVDSLGEKNKEKAREKLREEMRVKDSLEREKKLKSMTKAGSASTKSKSIVTNDDDEMPNNHWILSPVLIFAHF